MFWEIFVSARNQMLQGTLGFGIIGLTDVFTCTKVEFVAIRQFSLNSVTIF